MANPEKVTVGKSYFEAILRRADFHTAARLQEQPSPTNVTLTRVEYDSLLHSARQFEALKNALFQGGITPDTLNILISGVTQTGTRKDSGVSVPAWSEDFDNASPMYAPAAGRGGLQEFLSADRRASSFGHNTKTDDRSLHDQSIYHGSPRTFDLNKRIGHGAATYFSLDEMTCGDVDSFLDMNDVAMTTDSGDKQQTLYFSGLTKRTTHHDLVSLIKGGKLLSVNIRTERSATVTFVAGAAEYLAWVKRNDIYLHAKRIDVKWAERQFILKKYIRDKIAQGATRNLAIHGALEKGLTDSQIRDDMEHIHNLVIVNITFRAGTAFVSTNSIPNALFARTCMMSRTQYKGCKIEFYHDECDVEVPGRTAHKHLQAKLELQRRPFAPANKFAMLDVTDDSVGSADEEDDTVLRRRVDADDLSDLTDTSSHCVNPTSAIQS